MSFVLMCTIRHQGSQTGTLILEKHFVPLWLQFCTTLTNVTVASSSAGIKQHKGLSSDPVKVLTLACLLSLKNRFPRYKLSFS